MRRLTAVTIAITLTLSGCKPITQAEAETKDAEAPFASYDKSDDKGPPPAAQDGDYDWSTADMSEYGGAEKFKRSRAICADVLHAEPPKVDWPNVEERKMLKGCDSEKLYYGIGMPADPAKARQCALLERDAGSGLGRGASDFESMLNYFWGEGILAIVYANGRGANRNFDIAIHMACGIDDAPAATDSRINHLAELRDKSWAGSDFEICDNATSGFSGTFCADHSASLASEAREMKVKAIAAGWTVRQKALFQKSYDLFEEYAEEAHGMDCFRGTAQAACAISGTEFEMERYLRRIENLSRGDLSRPQDSDSSGDFISPLSVTDDKEWQKFAKETAEIDKATGQEELGYYETARKDAVAARRKFEAALLAFTRATYPQYNDHQIRKAFADL